MKKQAVSGYMMAGIGFAFILFSALNYIFGWKKSFPPAAIGMVFLAVGMMIVKKSRKDEKSIFNKKNMPKGSKQNK